MKKYLIVVWKWTLNWIVNEGQKILDNNSAFIDFIGQGSKFEVKVESGGNIEDELKFIGFTKSNSYDNSKSYTSSDITTECNNIFKNEENQILLLLHSNEPDRFNEKEKNEILRGFAGKKLKARLFFGGTGKVYEKLIDESQTYFLKNAINNPKNKDSFSIKRANFLEVWDWYWNKLELENLKRDIINLWLPLAIDIQGLSEVEESRRQNYLKEIFNELDKNDYVKNLSDGWEEVKKILLPDDDKKEVLDKKYQLAPDEKKKVSFPVEITAENLKKFVKENWSLKKNNPKDPNFLPNWLQEVVTIINKKINESA